MFYLRKIDKENKRESNSTLGKTYVYEHKDLCKDWDYRLKHVLDWMSEDDKERCFGIVYDEGGSPTPLFGSSDNYIMTDSGRTYSKLQ